MGLLSTLGLTLPQAIQDLESRMATPPPSKPSATSIAPGTGEAKPKPEAHAAADSLGNPPVVPPRPRPEADIIAEVGHAEDILNDLNDDAVEFIERTTGKRIPKTNRQGPHRPVKPDQIIPGERVGERRAKRGVVKTNDVEIELEEIEHRGGQAAKSARTHLERIRGARKNLRDLGAELVTARAGGPSTGPVAPKPVEAKLGPLADEYVRQAEELADEAKAIEAEEKTFQKLADDARKSFDSGKTDPDTFLKQNAEVERKAAALTARRDALSGKAASMQAQAESMVAKLGKEMPTELEAAFKTNNPREILEHARTGKGAARLGGMLSVLGVLATGYFLVQSIRYVLDATGGLAKVERALEVGGTLAAGLGLEALVAEIAASGAIGAVVVGALSADDHNPIPAMEAREKQLKQMNAKERHDIAVFLEKNAPGSVRNNGGVYEILDMDLWNKTVEQVHEMKATEQSKNLAKLLNRARDLGAADGRSGLGFVRASEMKEWDEVVKSERPIDTLRELLKHYQAGYKKGNVDQVVLIERVRKIGTSDGEAGTKRDRDSLLTTKETAAFIQAGTSLPNLISKAYSAYDEAYMAAVVRRGMPALNVRPSKPAGRR